ncbi:MAG: hypothetical protein EAZ89_01590 [Bacteroidetes bacterium]|nr:MAG: hypothetical protein EAZ89_01590 [Bacteroidota bacterium]
MKDQSYTPEAMEDPEESALLRSIARKEPYEAPEGYFEGLENRIFSLIDEADPLSAAPILSSIPKNSSFTVPEGYFEAFPERMTRLVRQETTGSRVRKLWQSRTQVWFSAGMAAAISLLIMYAAVSFGKNDPAGLEGIPTEDLMAAADVEHMDLDLLTEGMDENDLNRLRQRMRYPITEDEYTTLLNHLDAEDFESLLSEE